MSSSSSLQRSACNQLEVCCPIHTRPSNLQGPRIPTPQGDRSTLQRSSHCDLINFPVVYTQGTRPISHADRGTQNRRLNHHIPGNTAQTQGCAGRSGIKSDPKRRPRISRPVAWNRNGGACTVESQIHHLKSLRVINRSRCTATNPACRLECNFRSQRISGSSLGHKNPCHLPEGRASYHRIDNGCGSRPRPR